MEQMEVTEHWHGNVHQDKDRVGKRGARTQGGEKLPKWGVEEGEVCQRRAGHIGRGYFPSGRSGRE